MPKTDIDYSNTIIYKITCRDPLIKDLYVGHTTNFVQRKYAHKQSCINEKCLNYKCKLYETIRNNGNWENWKMEIINFFECKNQYEARKKEQEYFVSLNATLNSIEPYAMKKQTEINAIFSCMKCNIVFSNEILLETHNKTNKHVENKEIDISNKYACKTCKYFTDKKSSYDKHILSQKHIKSIISDTVGNSKNNLNNKNKCYNCERVYISRNGLWKHKKKCKIYKNIIIDKPYNNIDAFINDNAELKKLMLDVIKNNNELQKQNQDFQLQMLEMCKTSNNI